MKLFGLDIGNLIMWRKREIADRVSKDIDDTNVLKFPEVKPELKLVEPPEPQLDTSRPPYTLGVNESGNTQFTMRNDYGSTTLTMTQEGVIDMIENLAHYIRKTHTITIKERE